MNLIWNSEKEYWVCPHCGTIYKQAPSWKPKANYCMKCHEEWY